MIGGRGYCPNCDDQVVLTSLGPVEGCSRCENAMIYDDYREYVLAMREAAERMEDCASSVKDFDNTTGHKYEHGQCSYCGLPKGEDPEYILPEGIDLDPETDEACSNCGSKKREVALQTGGTEKICPVCSGLDP